MKSTPQQSRSRRTLERILAAASAEFAGHGVSGSTTTSIAERAGVSVGSLYRFFDDKESIAAAISDRYLADATTRYGEVVERIETVDDLVPALRQIVRIAAELQLEHPGYYRITQDDIPNREESPARSVRDSLVEYFASVLDGFGLAESPESRRRLISLITETVRHTLAVLDPDDADRDADLEELEAMVVSYFAVRLGIPIHSVAT